MSRVTLSTLLFIAALVVVNVAMFTSIAIHGPGWHRHCAEATCWARGTEHVATTPAGVVCSDGAVVPAIAAPGKP